MRVRILTGFCALFFLAVASCDKEKDFTKATVRDSGDVSQGGCGYLLDVDGAGRQRPRNLPSAYQHEGMRVKLRYSQTGVNDTCRNASSNEFYELINIDEIKRDI